MRFALLKKFVPIGATALTLRDPPKTIEIKLSDEGRPLVVAEVGRQDLFAEAIQVSDDEGEAIFTPGHYSFVFRHLRVAVDEVVELRGEPA